MHMCLSLWSPPYIVSSMCLQACVHTHMCMYAYMRMYLGSRFPSLSFPLHFILCIHTIPMGWLRLVGSLKSQVSFAEYRLFYRALLQKRPMILRSLPIVATPYAYMHIRHLFIYIHTYAHVFVLSSTLLLHFLSCTRQTRARLQVCKYARNTLMRVNIRTTHDHICIYARETRLYFSMSNIHIHK